MRDAVRELDPGVPVFMMRTLADVTSGSLAGPRFLLTLLAVFAGVALFLGAVGVYGVISQAVSQRTGEIGVRRALGAHELHVVGMVLRQGAAVALAGVAMGLAGATLLAAFLERFLFQVTATDPWTYAVVAGSVTLVAAVAVVVPARRASRIDPMTALRVD